MVERSKEGKQELAFWSLYLRNRQIHFHVHQYPREETKKHREEVSSHFDVANASEKESVSRRAESGTKHNLCPREKEIY